MSESTPVDWNMKMRLAADRVLRAMTLKRQSRVAVLASAALSVVATAQPSLLPPELIVLKDLLNVSAISSLLKEVAEHGNKLSDEEIATQMETLLPADQLDPLVIGQNDLLGVLTRQHSWQQQMLWLQEADGEAGARLLAGFAEMTGDLATIRNAIGTAATQEQMKALLRLITEEVLPLLTAAMQERYEMSGDFRGGMVNINSTVTIAWPEGQPYIPPPPPALGELPWPDYLPPGALIPFDRNPFFTGRGEELVELAALLLPMTNEGRSELVTGHSSLVTISTGIGGVGKTQLAIEFAYRFGRFFHGLHWVSAENPDAVDTAVAECGRRMRLHPTFGNLSLSDQVALTEAVWAGPEARLIILDNCEQPDVLARWRPKGGGARLLVTSRSGHWPRSLGAVEFPLDTLTRDQSVALLEAYLSPALSSELETRRSLLAAVAFELGDLPLALHLAGSFLESYASTPAGTLEALLAELRDPALSLRGAALTGRGTEGSPTKHELHVANTFLLSLRRLEDTAAGGEALAKALLARAACFAPGEPIPAGLLRATLSDNVTSLDVADALRALVGVGLLERVKAATQAAGTNEAYRLHRLVARFADGALAGEMTGAQRSVERVAQALLDRVWESKDPRELRLAIFHLRYIVNSASLREDAASLILINDLGLCLEISGDFAGGQLYHERALAIRERVLGPEHPDTAESLNNIGIVLQEQGDLAGARLYFERALTILEAKLDPNHPYTQSVRANLQQF